MIKEERTFCPLFFYHSLTPYYLMYYEIFVDLRKNRNTFILWTN